MHTFKYKGFTFHADSEGKEVILKDLERLTEYDYKINFKSIIDPPPQLKKLGQSIFVGKDKSIKFACNCTNRIRLFTDRNQKCNTTIEREFTSDGMTFDEAMECFEKGELEVHVYHAWQVSGCFNQHWKDGVNTLRSTGGLKLSQYRRKPEPEVISHCRVCQAPMMQDKPGFCSASCKDIFDSSLDLPISDEQYIKPQPYKKRKLRYC